MRNSVLFSCRNFCRADIEKLVNLRGIANQHLPIQALGEPNRERRLAGSSRPENDDKRGERAHLETVQKRHSSHSSTTAARISVPKTCVRLSFTSVLLLGARLDIVVKSGAQFDKRAFELGRQWLEGNGSANRGQHRAVQRLFSGGSFQDRLGYVNVAVAIDVKCDVNDSLVSHVIAFWENGSPILHHNIVKASHITVEVHALGVREDGHAASRTRAVPATSPSGAS